MSPDLADVVLKLRSPAWQARAEAALQRLVEISSHSADRQGCQAQATALLELLALPGLATQRFPDPSGKHGDHVAFWTEAAAVDGARAAAPFTLLIGHLDTVFSAAAFSGYRVSESDGVRRAHGPGVYDMKGGLVAIAFALQALAEVGALARVPLRGVIVSDEEVGSPSSQALLRRLGQGASCALGFESGRAGDAIITRRKGLGALQVRAQGKAAHAGNLHHEGHNAIWALARFVDAAQSLTDYGRGITVNVGRIEGGQGRNVVPDLAEAQVDFRFVALEDAAQIEAALRQAAVSAAAGVPGTKITVSGGVTRLPLCRSEASAALRDRYGRCQRAAGLAFAEAPLLGGGSDASTVAPLPAIDGLGPRGSGFHTLEEQVELHTLLQKAEALARFLCDDERS